MSVNMQIGNDETILTTLDKHVTIRHDDKFLKVNKIFCRKDLVKKFVLERRYKENGIIIRKDILIDYNDCEVVEEELNDIFDDIDRFFIDNIL